MSAASADANRATGYLYDSAGRLSKQLAFNFTETGSAQIGATTYTYGVSESGAAVPKRVLARRALRSAQESGRP